jgi:hypothetical protein
VNLKRLRYAVEVLRPLLPQADDAYMKQLQAAQLALGEIQDLVVLRAWLREHPRWTRGTTALARQAARLVGRELRERVAALRERRELIASLAALRPDRALRTVPPADANPPAIRVQIAETAPGDNGEDADRADTRE